MMSKVQTIHLFNCDQTYKFDAVEEWLERDKTTQRFSVQQHYFSLSKMAEMSEETIPRLNMDLAVFVVHAHESRLSINEDKAGIGYAKIYRALLQKTGKSKLIVSIKYRHLVFLESYPCFYILRETTNLFISPRK